MTAGDEPILYTPPSALAPWHRAFLWGVFILALLARAAFLKQIQDSPLWAEPGPGAAGGSPVYSWIIEMIARGTGPGLMAPRLLQAVMGAAACALLYRLGRQAFGPAAGLAAGLAGCLFGPWLVQVAAIAPDAPAVFLVTAALHQLFAANASQRGLLATSGICLGLAALFHPPVARAALPIAIWLIVDPWVRGGRSSGRLRESGGRFVAFAVGLFLVALPVAARGFHLHGSPLVSFADVWIGTDAGADAYAPAREAVAMIRVLDPIRAWLLPAAAAGLALLLLRWREGLGIFLPVAAWRIPGFFGLDGVPASAILPLLLALAGSAIVEAAPTAVSPRRIRGWLAVAIAVVVYLIGPGSI